MFYHNKPYWYILTDGIMSYGMYYESIYLYSTSFTHKTPLFGTLQFMFVHFHMHATPITTDLFLQAIIIPNALVFIVIVSSLFLWGTLAPIVEVIN